MTWPLVKLSEVATLINGRAYKKHEMLSEGKYPLMRVGNFFSNRGWYYSDLELPERQYCDNGDLLYAWSASFGPRIWDGKKVIYHYHIWKLDLNEKLIDKKYLLYALQKDVEKIKQEQGSGSTMIHVTKTAMEDREIPLPPLDEQKRIAAILDKADSVRRKRQQAIDLADDFLRSVFLDMFGDPLVNSKKWQVQNLGELTTKITDGKHGDCEDEVGSGYYFISAKDVNHGRINYENTRQINKKEFDEVHRRTDLQAGDLVMVNTGATIGRVAIVMDDEKTCKTTFQKSVAIIKPKGDLLNSNFLKYIFLLRVKDFASVGSGSAIKNLLLSKMREFPIIVPPMELQRKFDRIVSHIESSSIRDSADSKLNDELFSSLSQKAFAGEL